MPKQPNKQTIQNESDVCRLLAPDIADWLGLVENLQQTKWDMLATPSNSTAAGGIAHLICARLSNELRASVLLTERGYALQALSNAATILEMAFTIAFIGTDAERATRWHKHDSDDSFVSVHDAIVALFRHCGLPDSGIPAEKQHYKQLCAAKHGNPRMFKRLGIHINESEQLVVYHGPYLAPEIVHTSRIALWFAARYMILGLSCYNAFHVVGQHHQSIAARLTACRETMTRLRNADILKYETPRLA